MSPIALPPDFQFSQGNLQDFVDCRRRFQLRHLLRLSWPALPAEPTEEFETQVRLGDAFHRLVHQHALGLGGEILARMAQAEDAGAGDAGRLQEWWQNYLHYVKSTSLDGPSGPPGRRYSEVTLSAPAGASRLVAKYDLIALDSAPAAVIIDWKTSRSRTPGSWLASRLQTRVYRYLLPGAGAALNGGQPIEPEHVEMVYWFASFPEDPEHLRYDAVQYRADGAYLAAMIAEIEGSGEDDFPLTPDVRRCRFCAYRSLCDRGVRAGDLLDAADELLLPEAEGPIELDLEQVAEIDF